MRNNRGVTLVELLVVIAIIAVLAGIIIPSVFKLKERAVLTVLERNVDGLYKILMFHEATDGLPTVNSGNATQNRKAIKAIIDGSFDVIKNPYKKSSEIISSGNAGSHDTAAIVISQRGTITMNTAVNNKNAHLWPLNAAESSKRKFIGALVIQISSDGYLIYSYPSYNEVDHVFKIPYIGGR